MQNQNTQIPEEYLKVANSPQIYEACQKIGEKFNLMIDQVGELDAEISDVLLGSSQSKDFVSNIIRRLEIGQDVAEKITAEVNGGIMQVLRDQLKHAPTNLPSQHADIEAAGGFTIEPPHPSTIPQPAEAPVHTPEQIISSIENPVPAPARYVPLEKVRIEPNPAFATPAPKPILTAAPAPASAPVLAPVQVPPPVKSAPIPAPTQPTSAQNAKYSEPIIDHLLSTSTARPIEKTIYQTPTKQNEAKLKAETQKRSGPDPYREATV
jgi:hypothetical protein